MATPEYWLSRKKGKQSGDLFKLDSTKTPEANIIEIIKGLYLKTPNQNDTSPANKPMPAEKPTEFRSGLRGMQRNNADSRRLSYLNALVTLICKEDRHNLGFTIDELMTCIRVSLIDDSLVIRAAALRVLRYLIKTESDVATFNNLKLPYLVTRSVDLMLPNEEERTQALRVVRRIVAVVGSCHAAARRNRAAFIEPGLLRCLAAVARAGTPGDGSGDRLSRPAIATLAEICVLNPDLFISCGGVQAVTRQLSECAQPRMAEALCGVLLHTLDEPNSRRVARIDLSCLSAPYCDFHFRPAGNDASRDEREMRLTCSRLSLLCVLRSWPGLLHFCHPTASNGLKALVAALYLPRLEVRKAILDLLYELVGLPQPEWTDEISVALDAVDPSDFQDSWRLNEGFVAAEGTSILPHLSATGPDITEIHLALLLQCFLEAGLLDGLAEVIVTSDTFISVRATVLLGQLMHLIHLFLPPQICSITPALPTLMSQASAGKPQALAAIAALKRLHSMLEARPASNSLFLDHIILYCSGAFREKVEDNTKSRKEKDNANMSKVKHETLHKENSIEFLNESDNENEPRQRHSIGSRADVVNRNVGVLVKSKSVSSRTSAAVSKVKKSANFFNLFERDSDSLIRSTLVMQNKDGNTWNWEIIRTILKETDAPPLLNLNDGAHVSWAARVVRHLQPAANKYSHADLSPAAGHGATRAGAMLVRQLLRHDSPDAQKLLEDLFSDVSRQIEAIETGSKAHECLFSPQHMCNTMCQMYFLFIGQLCHTQKGLKLFKDTRLYENLLELSTKTHHSCYVKLVISSLDYTLDSYPRDILAKTLRCPIQASRLYATQFLNVLLRASRKSRELVRKKSKLKKNFVQEVRYKDDDGNGVDMDTWVLQMLIGQIKDESKAIVKCSLGILEEAFSVPVYLEKMIPMKDTLAQNCRLDKSLDPASLDFSAVGDRGYILWLSLEVAASGQSSDSKSIGFLKKHLDFWTKSYNYRYVRVVEASVHSALTLCASARQTRARRSARPPPHVHGALAQRPPGSAARALLAAALPPHARILQRKKCSSEQEVMDLKASLWAIGNTAVTASGLQLLMNLTNGYLEDSIPVHIIRLAKYCPVYSVRATAFYVLGLIGSTYDGANILGELGWLCVRHTRHDQFPVIPDESYPPYDGSGHQYLITSPDRRYNYDADASEHSDHTDQSTAESLQSDYPKKALIADQDKDQDVVDHKTNDRTQDNRKSHTLPTQGCSVSHDRLTLTESRTVDILRDFSNYERPERQHPRVGENRLIGRMNSLDHAHEGRVRNTSESSTSGVSSCDSFLGKYAIPDRVLTLSPIPSSSSLYGMKSTSSSQKPKLSESMRRTSTSSTDPPSSPPTQLDMSGYATLKSLNKHRRPHLSESAATGSSELEDLTWLLTESSRRSKPFSSLRDRTKATRERQSKMSVVDYDWRPLGAPPPVRAAAAPHRAPPAPRPPPPAYMGICLPQHLADLFPRDDEPSDAEKDGTIRSEQARRRVPSFLADSSNASTDNKSRATPDSQLLTSYRGIDSTGFANRSMNAAVVAMASNINRIGSTINNAVSNESTNYIATKPAFNTNASTDNEAKTKSTSNPSISIDKITKIKDNRKEPSIDEKDRSVDNSESLTVDKENNEVEYKNEDNKPDGSEKEVKSNAVEVRKEDGNKSFTATGHGVGRIQPWRHSTADCLACVRTRPPSAHELREAFFADMEGWGVVEARSAGSPPAPAERPCPRALALHHAHFMANPVHLRQTRSALLALKQRHPDVFRSPCVYSDVCALLARGTYLLCARRFLQDLFLDTNFECFAAEPAAILSRHTSVQNTQP